MVKMVVTQVTFVAGDALIGGVPEGDLTKVIIATADPVGALVLAMAVASGEHPVVEPPDDSIVEILERPE
jgi:hypothetical protein